MYYSARLIVDFISNKIPCCSIIYKVPQFSPSNIICKCQCTSQLAHYGRIACQFGLRVTEQVRKEASVYRPQTVKQLTMIKQIGTPNKLVDWPAHDTHQSLSGLGPVILDCPSRSKSVNTVVHRSDSGQKNESSSVERYFVSFSLPF